jgi:hypothetical protein
MTSKSKNTKGKKSAKVKAETSDINLSKKNLEHRKEALKKIIRYLSDEQTGAK